MYTAASSLIIFLVNTAGVILITRNLTSEDFGVYGMVVVLTGFAALFVDIGLAQAIIQRPKITHEIVSALFWINLAIATLIALTVAAITPLLVWFYSEPRLAPVNLVMSGTFVLSALRLQHQALLRRHMSFKALSLIDTSALIIGTCAAVFVAYRGFGVWALVVLPIVTQVAGLAGVWVVSGWVPGLPERGHGVRKMLTFGANITGFKTLGYFSRNTDNIMLGYAWGAGPLGLYTRAYSLIMLPVTKFNTPLSGVVTPALSRVAQDPERYRRIYMQMVRVCAVVITPLVSILILTIHATVPLLLGERWLPIIPIFYALAPMCVLQATGAITSWLYFTIGHVDRLLRWSIYNVPFILVAACVGVQYGPQGMALAMSCFFLIRKPIGIAYAAKGTPVRFGEVVWAVSMPILGSGISVLPALGWLRFLGGESGLLLQLFVLTALFAGTYLLLLMATPLGKQHRTSLLRFKKSM